ncbi:cyclophilin-like protein [Meredithblackwellia eburnea MCA 4105]
MATVVITEPITSGLVLLKTSIGDISIELWSREAPKACRNFVQLCLEGYYDGCIFHRVVPNFIAQTGDPSGTGSGGECIYDEGTFEDEFSQRLKFTRRGLVAMANQGTKNSNLSQFFFTLDSTMELQNRNTIFGRVAGDTLFNVLALNSVELEPDSERPTYPPVIKSVEVLDNPFQDIVPRITAKERREQERAKKEMKIERAKQREAGKRKGTKNKGLLSFGDEPEEEVTDAALAKAKFKSAHDALDDARLGKEVIDDRGTSATLPPGMEGPSKKRKETEDRREERSAPEAGNSKPSELSKLQAARAAKEKAAPNAQDKLKSDLAKMEADLKKMTRQERDADDEEGTKAKKQKRSGPSLLELEREKYMKGGVAIKGKKSKDEDLDLDDVLAGFKQKIKDAPVHVTTVEEKAPSWLDAEDGDEEEADDDDWMGHKLVFRKDVTLDRHTVDEYATYDPLSKNTLSLDEMRQKADSGRKYAGEKTNDRKGQSGSDRRGGASGDRRGGASGDRRVGGGSGGGRDSYRGSNGRDRDRESRGGRQGDDRRRDFYDSADRPEGRSTTSSSWKKDRVSDLA